MSKNVLSMCACSLLEETLARLTELIVIDWPLEIEWICFRVDCSSCFISAVRHILSYHDLRLEDSHCPASDLDTLWLRFMPVNHNLHLSHTLHRFPLPSDKRE